MSAINLFEGLGAAGDKVSTVDPLAARSRLMRRLAVHTQELAPRVASLDFLHQEASLDTVSLHLLSYGAGVIVQNAGRSDFYLLQVMLEGEIDITTPDWRLSLAPGQVFLMNPCVYYRKVWSPKARQLMVKIPRPLLGEPSFAPAPVAMEGEGRPLLRFLDYLCRDLRDGTGGCADPDLRLLHEQALLRLVLGTFPQADRPAESPAVPRYLARAERFMRENAGLAVTMEAVAAAAGISERTLREAFQRFRGKTPTHFLQEQRLARARRALLERDGASVTDIALASGFPHLGRFAQAYARSYGETPSATFARRAALAGQDDHATAPITRAPPRS